MDLDRLRDRRVIIAAGAGGLALAAALGVGIGAMVRGAHHTPPAAPASAAAGSLQVEMGAADGAQDLNRPLRCFVGGQFVGMLTLKDCAQKNGVPTGQLDVGRDTSGQIAATSEAQAQPPPSSAAPPESAEEASPEAQGTAGQAAPAPAPQAACWRFSGQWRKLGDDMSLDACVQALFAGKCVRPGQADYGRWGGDTLRLVPGRVERGSYVGGFRPLVAQPPGDCAIPHLSE
jgi:hypothetical protein